MKYLRSTLITLLVLGWGCPHNPTPTPVNPIPPDLVDAGIPNCVNSLPIEACDGSFTAEGYACVLCSNGMGCLDKVEQVYCLNQSACIVPDEDGRDTMCNMESFQVHRTTRKHKKSKAK